MTVHVTLPKRGFSPTRSSSTGEPFWCAFDVPFGLNQYQEELGVVEDFFILDRPVCGNCVDDGCSGWDFHFDDFILA